MSNSQEKASLPAGVKSAARTLDLLEALARAHQPLTHSELAARTGIPKSSLTQLLRTLADRHYVECSVENGPYSIGRAARDLIGLGIDVRHVVAAASEIMERLCSQSGHSCGLNVRAGDFVERVHGVTAQQGLTMHVGVRAPLYASSSGKIVLAFLAKEALEDYLERVELRPIASKSLRSPGALREQVRKVRTEGLAFSQGEFTNGVVGLSAPVFDVHSKLVACLGLAVPTAIFESERTALTAILREAASAVTSGIRAGSRQP